MPGPNINDIRRLRNLSRQNKTKRIPIIGGGFVAPLTSAIILDPFSNPLNFFEIQQNYSGTGEELVTEDNLLYAFTRLGSDVVTLNSTEFYNGGILVGSTRYQLKSLFFIDNLLVSKSTNFSTPLDNVSNNISYRREYYNENGVLSVDTQTLSVYNFNLLDNRLSADTNIIRGQVYEPLQVNTFNTNLSGYNVEQFTLYKVGFGSSGNPVTTNTFSALSTLSFSNVTFTDAFTGVQNFTLSTIRNDQFNDLNVHTSPLTVFISDRFTFQRIKNDNINTVWNSISWVDNPDAQEDKFRFLNNPTDFTSEWNTEWWGYNKRDLYNFSGVSYRSDRNDENNITLITNRHGVTNKHFTPNYQIGDKVFFYDHTTGNAVSALIDAVHNPNNSDIFMVRVDRDMTQLGDIKIYKLPLIENKDFQTQIIGVTQGGNGPFGTGKSDRHAGLSYVDPRTKEYSGIPAGTYFESYNNATRLETVSSVFENKFFSLSSFAVGDSSSPVFIPYNNDLLLATTIYFTTGTDKLDIAVGPSYGIQSIQDILTNGIETLGNPGNVSISAVRIS